MPVDSNIGLFVFAILVNIGMWLERLIIVIPGLSRKTPFSFDWGAYHPSLIEITIIVGGYAFVFLLLLLFAKAFPLIPLFDIKEGQTLSEEIKIGRRTIPALRVEE